MARRFSSILALAIAFCAAQIACAQQVAWQIIKVGGRDYLSAQNIADFYQLQGGVRTVDRRIFAGDGRVNIEFGGNPRELLINGVKHWLSFPAVNQNGQLLISRFDLAKTVEPSLRPAMVANLSPFHTVVIDAGHGGNDRGASSTVGCEKDYTLDVVRDLKKSLEDRGFRVILTRGGDTYVPLEDRALKANDTGDAVFVSVHFNSESNGVGARGFEAYAMTPRGAASTGDGMVTADQFKAMPGNDFDDASLAMATCVQHSLLGHIPLEDRGVRRARFAVLRLTHAPAILVEGGFLTNGPESKQINDPAWRRKFADSISQGIEVFQGLAERKSAPKLLADYRSEQLPLNGSIVDPMSIVVNAALPSRSLLPVSNGMLQPATETRERFAAVPAEAR